MTHHPHTTPAALAQLSQRPPAPRPDPLWRRAAGLAFSTLAFVAFIGALLGWWGALDGGR